jgi:hypothetical protein
MLDLGFCLVRAAPQGHRQVVQCGMANDAVGRMTAVDRRHYAANGTPVTSAQVVKVWLRAE